MLEFIFKHKKYKQYKQCVDMLDGGKQVFLDFKLCPNILWDAVWVTDSTVDIS